MYKQFIAGLSGVAFLCSVTGVANATPTTFFGQDQNPGASTTQSDTANSQFQAKLTGTGTEDFEGFTSGNVPPLTINFPGSVGAITANLSGDGDVKNLSQLGEFATSGDQYYDTGVGGTFNLAFSSPIAAFGFYGTDIGDVNGQLTLTLTDTTGATSILMVPHSINSENGNELYFGFIDTVTSYTDIAFGNTSATDRFGFDDMTIGDFGQVTPPTPVGVPEPSSLLMLGGGLLGLGLFVRRRKSTNNDA